MKSCGVVILTMLVGLLVIFTIFSSGCKRGANATEPMHTTRAVYSDTGADGIINLGDFIYIAFDREIATNFGALGPAQVFVLSGATDSFGTGAAVSQHSAYAVRVTLGAGASLSTDANGFISSNIKISPTLPAGVIRDGITLTDIPAGGVYVAISGRTGYTAPVVQSVAYVDANSNFGIDQNDLLVITFSGNISAPAGIWTCGGIFELPVHWDSLGALPVAAQTTSNTISITLGSVPKLNPNGTFSITALTAGSPSGLDIHRWCTSGGVTFDCGMETKVTVPPAPADIYTSP